MIDQLPNDDQYMSGSVESTETNWWTKTSHGDPIPGRDKVVMLGRAKMKAERVDKQEAWKTYGREKKLKAAMTVPDSLDDLIKWRSKSYGSR